jgi:hypothetical protein
MPGHTAGQVDSVAETNSEVEVETLVDSNPEVEVETLESPALPPPSIIITPDVGVVAATIIAPVAPSRPPADRPDDESPREPFPVTPSRETEQVRASASGSLIDSGDDVVVLKTVAG